MDRMKSQFYLELFRGKHAILLSLRRGRKKILILASTNHSISHHKKWGVELCDWPDADWKAEIAVGFFIARQCVHGLLILEQGNTKRSV